ncbi:hypothetical protein G9C98_003098 [Cotesia typhae]|uniref:Uncharacterized protein n=1 Tax=Cotesia typhae TaxID=2053667 RepID=A0A8J5UXL0_9HYME|nr:hypothetical protein G9C98_003098 [Cotesia typhae]
MRNGAAVKWKKISKNESRIDDKYLNNYDNLPKASGGMEYVIYGVDATDSGISHEGFPHFGMHYSNILIKNLKTLKLRNLPGIKDKNLIQDKLCNELKGCKIIYEKE